MPLSKDLDEEMQSYDSNWTTGKDIYKFADAKSMALLLNSTKNG